MPPKPESSVRVVFISDTHSHLGEVSLPMGDVLCHTGDITFCSSGGKQTLEKFNQELAALPHPHKVVIAGNHDRRIEQLGSATTREILSSAHYLENSGVRLEGLHFWGSPISARRKRKSSNTAFQYSEERQRLIWKCARARALVQASLARTSSASVLAT
jgi:predicted phosphohydrolase